jgi:RNA polymerase sigma factor (sigma-70 family)
MDTQMDISNQATTIRYWVDLFSDSLYSWAFHKTSSKETAEDLVQETFLAAIRSFDKFRGDSNPKTWLFAILNHKIADHYRHVFRQQTTTDDSILSGIFDGNNADRWRVEERPKQWASETEHLLDDTVFRQTLQQCLEKLPAPWFVAIRLKYMEEKRGDTIGQELGVTTTNFWQIIHRAKLQLRKCLELNWFKK